MKIKELNQGIYKIRKANSIRTFRANGKAVQLLRVTGVGQSKLYFIDHDTFGTHPDQLNNMEGFEVLSRYDGDPQISNCRIKIQFTDASGENFEFSVRDAWSLRSVFDSMPWLKRPFGYFRRKNNS